MATVHTIMISMRASAAGWRLCRVAHDCPPWQQLLQGYVACWSHTNASGSAGTLPLITDAYHWLTAGTAVMLPLPLPLPVRMVTLKSLNSPLGPSCWSCAHWPQCCRRAWWACRRGAVREQETRGSNDHG